MACFDNEKPKYNVVITPYILFAVMQRDRSRQVQVTKHNYPHWEPPQPRETFYLQLWTMSQFFAASRCRSRLLYRYGARLLDLKINTQLIIVSTAQKDGHPWHWNVFDKIRYLRWRLRWALFHPDFSKHDYLNYTMEHIDLGKWMTHFTYIDTRSYSNPCSLHPIQLRTR